MPPRTIDLGKYKTGAVFSGRARGRAVREALGLDREDEKERPVVIAIPEDTISFNPSFFLGLLGPSVRALGRDAFIEKYGFNAHAVHHDEISEGIDRALRDTSALT